MRAAVLHQAAPTPPSIFSVQLVQLLEQLADTSLVPRAAGPLQSGGNFADNRLTDLREHHAEDDQGRAEERG
jgi:hypothetical protein